MASLHDTPWWLWPVALIGRWLRQQPAAEHDTVPVPVPQYADTLPVEPPR